MRKRGPISILCLFLIINVAAAADYYVSPSGTASWSQCTDKSMPCSIFTANDNAKAGDTVYLRGGEYTGTTDKRMALMPANSGQPGNYITFEAYPGEKPILRKYGVYKPGLRYYSLIVILKKQYIKVKGITVYEPISSWFSIAESNHITFEDMVFDKYNQIPSGRPAQINESSYLTFDNCYFNAGDLPTDYGTDGVQTDMLDIWGDSDHLLWIHCDFRHTSHNEVYYFTSDSQYTVFYDCTFSNKWRHAVTQRIGPHMMDNNTFFNMGEECGQCPWFADRCSPPRTRMPGTIYTHGLDHSIIRNNVIYNSFGAFSFGEQYKSPEYNWIYHNTVYKSNKFDGENWNHGIMWYDESHPDQAFQNNHFINNIMYDTGNDDNYIIKVRNVYGPGLNPNNNVISNNLLGDPDPFKIQWGDSTGTLSHIEDVESDWVKGTNVDGDPMFVDTDITDPDLSLRQESPAIDKGTWLATVKAVSGNVITVDDATPFFSGPGAPWFIIHPDIKADTIYSQDHDSALIQSIDYGANKLTVDSASGFSAGDKLTVVDFSGTLPDIGAFEYTGNAPQPYCGDETCNGAETCTSCPGDCGACPPACGDGTCNGAETCSSCPEDCDACASCGDGKCDSDESCSTCPSDCSSCPEGYYETQESEDDLIESVYPDYNYGVMDSFYIGSRNDGWGSRFLIKFPGLISSGAVPEGSSIDSASLILTNVDPQRVNSPIDLKIRRVIESWTEGDSNPATVADPGETTWDYRAYNTVQWEDEGCSPPGSSSTSGEVSKTYSTNPSEGTQSAFDVTSIVQEWADNGESSNNGFILLAPGQEMSTMNFVRFASSEYLNPAYRPKLVVQFTAGSPCGHADLPPQDNAIDIGELISFINRWKSGDVGISELMDAIGKWKSGC